MMTVLCLSQWFDAGTVRYLLMGKYFVVFGEERVVIEEQPELPIDPFPLDSIQ